jgi:Bacterial regulatory helix-turn-helix protein, lysR family
LVNLQALLATAAAGFSAAARKLDISTSVVAKRVTQLEARIGTPLFHRATRQPVPREFPIPELWVKAAIPERRRNAAAVQALLTLLQTSLAPAMPT